MLRHTCKFSFAGVLLHRFRGWGAAKGKTEFAKLLAFNWKLIKLSCTGKPFVLNVTTIYRQVFQNFYIYLTHNIP
jgi:hypothetical protein